MSLADFIRAAFTGAAEVAVGNAVERLGKMNKARAEHLTKPAPVPAYVSTRGYTDELIADIVRVVHEGTGITNIMVRRNTSDYSRTVHIWRGHECFHPIEMIIDDLAIMRAIDPKRMVMKMVCDLERTCYCVQRPGDEQ